MTLSARNLVHCSHGNTGMIQAVCLTGFQVTGRQQFHQKYLGCLFSAREHNVEYRICSGFTGMVVMG